MVDAELPIWMLQSIGWAQAPCHRPKSLDRSAFPGVLGCPAYFGRSSIVVSVPAHCHQKPGYKEDRRGRLACVLVGQQVY